MRDPLHHWVPPHEESYGNLAAGVAAQLGMSMDDEQRMILDAIYAEDEPGVPTCFEVGVVAPRQNLKTATLEIAALTDAFVLGVPLHVWTAHLFPTARKSFEHMVALIGSDEDFRGRCEWPPRASHGEESIQLLTGEKIEVPRSVDGRGWLRWCVEGDLRRGAVPRGLVDGGADAHAGDPSRRSDPVRVVRGPGHLASLARDTRPRTT